MRMIVAFIEPKEYTRTAVIAEKLQDVITKLVVKDGAYIFLFSNAGQFDDDCYEIVSKLKKHYPYIERHYYHGTFDYDKGYVDWMSEFYDTVNFPPMGFVISPHSRDCLMIDICEVLVTCGATSAIEYARKKKKRIINLLEQ